MIYDVSQKFFFDAAHTLNREVDAISSKRIHGHTYQVEITVSGVPDQFTGMVVDLGHLRVEIESIRGILDHCLLDEVEGLGVPTLENLCAYIAKNINLGAVRTSRVRVWRDGIGDSCTLRLGSS